MAFYNAAEQASKKGGEAASHWAGHGHWSGKSASETREIIARGGSEEYVKKAESMLEKMELALPETQRAEFFPSVSGAYPCVPDAILGMPEPMRAKTIVYTDAAPIRIGMIVTVSADVSEHAILQRGIAMLAVLFHLQNSGRAVELWSISILNCPNDANNESVVATKVCNGVLSLAEASMVLCETSLARRIPFTVQFGLHNSCGGWPGKFDYQDGGKTYAAALAKRMGFQMILPALTAHEQREVTSNPAKWMLAKYSAIQAQIEGEA